METLKKATYIKGGNLQCLKNKQKKIFAGEISCFYDVFVMFTSVEHMKISCQKRKMKSYYVYTTSFSIIYHVVQENKLLEHCTTVFV